jgi:hypothetical protein
MQTESPARTVPIGAGRCMSCVRAPNVPSNSRVTIEGVVTREGGAEGTTAGGTDNGEAVTPCPGAASKTATPRLSQCTRASR